MRKRRVQSKKSQPYDTSLKQWVKNDPNHIIPVLLPGAEYLEPLDIETIRPTMRANRVFKILYYGRPCILNIELETGYDEDIRSRVLVYSSILYHEHKLPVMTLIIYPFRTTIAVSPLRTGDDDGLITFRFRTLPLFSLDAGKYIEEHITCMYPLLPSMQGVSAAVLEQVTAELAALYREDEVALSEQLVLMELLLSRTTTISAEEKAKIEGSLKMYDPLWEEHPKVKRIKAKAKADAEAEVEAAKAEIEARVKAEIEAKMRVEAEARARVEAETNAMRKMAQAQFQKAMVQIVRARFPELTDLAQQKVQQIESVDVLSFLIDQISEVKDEAEARGLLRVSAA